MKHTVRVLGIFGIVITTARCGGGGPAAPTEPTTLEITAGQGQQGQVGNPLAAKIIVKASNNKGPVAGVTVSVTTETQGGGSVSPRSVATGADGTAQFTWTLGSKLGTQTLTATFTGTGTTSLTATVTANATAGPASNIIAASETSQPVVVGHAVPVLPSVQVTDGFGNPIAGIAVAFEAIASGSTLTGTTQTTNAQGLATIGGWTIGLEAQSYTIRAGFPGGGGTLFGGATVQFEARGIPAALVAVDGANQTANAGTAVPVSPAVKATRDDGSALPNVTVDFTVQSGGGSVTGGSVVTGADGVARVSRWVLGVNPGPNRIQAATSGRASVPFDATGVLATPAQVIAGTAVLSGFFGNFLNANPEVTVKDAQGNPVAGATVSFQVSAGGGQVTQPAGTTDFQGKATTTSWRLGSSGAQTVSATVGSLPPVNFAAQATAPPASTFKFEVRYVTGTTPTASQAAAFTAAAERWKALVLSGAAPYQVVATDIDPTGSCPSMLGEVVDGTVLHVKIQNLNNPNILGATGLCVIRDAGFLPVQALMILNSTAVATLETNNLLAPVILHEMGHALGFGTLWSITIPGLGSIELIQGGGSCSAPVANPTFSGAAARAAFYGAVATGTTFTSTPVPIENTSGCGTAYSHWRKSTFGPELLTGFLSAGQTTPLSAMTVQSMRDIGYIVNDVGADTYSFQAFVQGLALSRMQLAEDPTLLQGPITVINRSGRTVARIPRPLK